MTYSTGSGDYNALMAAVLAHAVSDGWTTTGGNWPISKGNVRGVDWTSYTASEADRTLLGGASKTARYIRIAIGTSTANATANKAANGTSVQVANMEYALTSWHIFSDPSVCDYIHVVANFSNGVNADCYTHFSFGELDKHGMGHTAIVYATSSPKRGYSVDGSVNNTCGDWNGGEYGRTLSPYVGQAAFSYPSYYNGCNNLVWIVDPTIAPLPASGWPAINALNDNSQVLNTIQHYSSSWTNIQPSFRTASNPEPSWSCWPQFTTPQPYSGAVSMAPLPFWVLQSLTSSAQIMYVGSFPNVRVCSMESYNPQTIITYGSEDWMLFPMLRSTPWAQMQTLDVVSSGRTGYAFKKVP